MKIKRALAALTLVAAIGCSKETTTRTGGPTPGSDSKPVTVKGSDTMVVLGQRFAEEYMNANPGASVQVNGGGSGTGIAALINGTVDLATASRPMKADERKAAEKTRNAAIVETPVALDSLAVFVHSANAVNELTMQQVAGIFQGKIRNWSEVGGKNAPIVLYGRESSSGTYEYFKEHVLSKEDFAPNVQLLQGTAAIINAVGKDPNGIGYGGIAYAKEVKAVAIKSDAATPAIAPSESTVADGSYPLTRKLYLYSFENSPARVKKFIEYTLTPQAQKVVTAVGYFPLTTTGATATATDTSATAAK